MSTSTTAKRPTQAELEALIAEIPNDDQTCDQLQQNIDDDHDVLNNLWELPPNRRTAVRNAMLKDIKANMAQMKAQHCH